MKNFPKIKIALVDDDIDEKFIFQGALDEIDVNYSFYYFKNSDDFINSLIIDQLRPDIVFIDMHMPKKNGLELVQELRRNKNFDGIRSVIYSNSVSEVVIQAFRSLGTTDFIIKPPDITEMKSILKKLIDTFMEQ